MQVPRVILKHPPRRIAFIKPSALGDIMHSLPVLTALRQLFPKAHITWIVNRLYEPLLCGHPDLNEVLAFDRGALRKGWMTGPAAYAGFLRLLRRRNYDLVIDLQGLLRTGLMAFATGAEVRIGLASAREGARWFYTHRMNDDRLSEHAVDRYWKVAQALGAQGEPRFTLPVDPAARLWALEQLRPWPRPWLAVGVGSRWQTKRWPPEHFASLVRQAQQRFGGTAIFIGAPDEMELSEQVAALVGSPAVNLAGQTSLVQLIALLGEADVTLANDTGPLHVAVALGRPVVAPYTCTLVRCTGPFGQLDRAVETEVWCRGSYLKRCDRLECMAELTPDRLWPALHEILLAWEQQRLSA